MEDSGRLDEHLRTGAMHDSGTRQEFASGAVRDAAAGKPRPDLISPHAHIREGTWMGTGAVKYSERNWEAGIPVSRCVASLFRHLVAYMLGQTNEDHMAAIRTNSGFIIHNEEEVKAGRMDPAIADMPFYEQQYAPWAEDEEDDNPMWDGLVDLMKATLDKVRSGESVTFTTPTVEECRAAGGEPYHTPELTPRVTGIVMHGPIPGPEAARPGDSLGDPPYARYVQFGSPTLPPDESKWNIVTNAPAAIEKRRLANAKTLQRLWTSAGLCEACKGRHPDTVGAKVYIAGPMRDYAAYNAPAFDGAAKEWAELGWIVLNPIQMDRDHDVDLEAELSDECLKTIIQRDLDIIMELIPSDGDGIAVLPGWEKSTGARAEVALARWLGLPVWGATTGKVVE